MSFTSPLGLLNHSETWVHTMADVLLTAVLMFGALSIFFITYISHVESEGYQSEINQIIKEQLPKALANYSDARPLVASLPFEQIIAAVELENSTNPARINNMWIIRSMIFVAILLAIVYLVFVLVIKTSSYRASLGVPSHFLTICFIIILIGLVEYWFFTRVASKFVPTLPSLLADTTVDQLKKGF